MLGIFGLLGLGGLFVSKTRETLDNAYLKEKARQRMINGDNPYGTYYNVRGQEIDYLTGRECSTKREWETGDLLLCDKYNRPYRNVTKEWLADRYDDLKEAHPDWMTTSYFGLRIIDASAENWGFWGKIWKDFQTGYEYFSKSYDNISFYVSRYSGEFIRISDGQVLTNREIEKKSELEGKSPDKYYRYASKEKIEKIIAERKEFCEKYRKLPVSQKDISNKPIFSLWDPKYNSRCDDRLAYEVHKKMGNVLAPRME